MTDRPAATSAAGWQEGAPDPLWSRPAPTMRARIHRLGLAIEVQANARRLLELALDAFGPPEPGAMPADAPDLRLSLIEGPPPGGDGWPVEWRDDAAATARPIFREHDGAFAAFDGAGSCVTADLHAGVAVVWVRAGAEPDRIRALLIESPLWRLATHRGLLALHGAAVAVDGLAIVVRGAAGAGKSSVALAADAAGWPVLAEEVVWIDPDRWAIWPIARRIHFDDDAALRLAGGGAVPPADRSSARPTASRHGGKTAVPLATAPPSVATPIGPLVLLEPVPGSSGPNGVAWHTVDKVEARARCEAERIVGEYAQPESGWDAVVARLCRGGAYAVRGGDPAARVAALGEIVRHWRRSRLTAPEDRHLPSQRGPSHG